MATFTKLFFSGSVDGKGIVVAEDGSPGTTIHTAHVTSKDEIWIYATNTDSPDVEVTLEWGGTDAPDNSISCTIPGKSGLQLIVPGFVLTNSKVVKAFAETADVIVIYGFVNRIS
ncbi:MAG: hypothetical protein RBT15_09500 [Gudongella sp.]|nr:hypothetical protein [Gudongella sp.]